MTRTNLIGCIACSTFMIGAAHAAEFQPGFYAVGQAGQTKFVSNLNTSQTLTSNSYLLSVGYEYTPAIAVEGGYGNLYTYNYKYSSTVYTNQTMDIFTLAAIYKPFPGKITPLISVGTVYGSNVYNNSYGSGSVNFNLNTYGVGLEVPLDERSAFRINYTGFSGDNSYVTGVGLLFRF